MKVNPEQGEIEHNVSSINKALEFTINPLA